MEKIEWVSEEESDWEHPESSFRPPRPRRWRRWLIGVVSSGGWYLNRQQEIMLQQTAVFRLGTDRWPYAPPAYDYQRLIVHDFSDCDFAAWVN